MESIKSLIKNENFIAALNLVAIVSLMIGYCNVDGVHDWLTACEAYFRMLGDM